MNETEDIVYRCKDCSKYSLCRYYYRRKETSQICHYFELQGKTGKWTFCGYASEKDWELGIKSFKCSVCDKKGGWKSPYCPNCGAKMEVDE